MKRQHSPSPPTSLRRLKAAMLHDHNGKSSQLKFVRPAQMQLFARVLCHPPLSGYYVVPPDQLGVDFKVVIESSKSFPAQSWEAVIWHNADPEAEWAALTLKNETLPCELLMVGSANRAQVYRYYFTGRLPNPTEWDAIKFTLKFRTSSSDTWKWVNDDSSLKDGELYFQASNLPEELDEYLDGVSPRFDKEEAVSEVPETRLWHLSTDNHDFGGTCKIGTPKCFSRWFSLIRIWSPWLAPRHGQEKKFAPAEDGVFASFLRWDGSHLVVLPVSGIDGVLSILRPDENGNVVVHTKRDQKSNYPQPTTHVLLAAGRTFDAATAAAMYEARKMVAGSPTMSEEKHSEMKTLLDEGIKPVWMENWYDGLTYCTWNALGQNLSQQRIFDALDTLKTNNIDITNLIIDDNWQSLDNAGDSQFKRGMTDFEANKEGFPKGLKYAVTEIRNRHPNIQHVAVWHALFGYWGGISPEGSIAKKYKTKEVRKQDGIAGGTMTVVAADEAPRFYDDFYKFLLASGVDSVKTDAQFFLDLLADPEDRRQFITAYQDAWTIASLRYFSVKAISCMSQIPQILFHTQLPSDKPRLMVRNSDDFFPDIPSSHPWHIFTNAHNSLFTSYLNVVPDWDMFQTSHPYSSFHAAGRCVSGGPIYITDEPGKHGLDLLRQMTARTTKGKTIILRPDCIGKTTSVYTAYEEERLLKVGTFVGGKGGTSILGCFNVSERQICELVHFNDFRGIEPGREYLIGAFTSGELSPTMALESEFPMVSLALEVKGWEILTAYPIESFTLRGSKGLKDVTKLAVLGLIGKMTGAAAVVQSSMQIAETGRLRVKASLKALGVVGIYISTLETLSVDEHFLVTMHNQAIPAHTVRASKTSPTILEIDIETAWKKMGLDSGWSNEISLDVFIT